AEAVVAWEVAAAIVSQFGQDRIDLIKENIERARRYAKEF
ncbi:chorismate synthase, partial [Geobacillus stearothermophilus]|nr:chorismate synthase [Geobacillus stearothermophilus]